MLLTKEKTWDKKEFEACIEGMCVQIKEFLYERVAFIAHLTPETIFLFFAIWKMGKVACPLSPRLPSVKESLHELGTELFIPQMPEPCKEKSWILQEDRLATLLFTSGSSGKPKIAALSIGNHMHSARASFTVLPLTSSDRWQVSLPLSHIAGISILWRCYLSGASMILSDTFDQATHLSLVPTQLARLLQKNTSLPLLKTVLLGGAPLPHFDAPWSLYPHRPETLSLDRAKTTGIDDRKEVHISNIDRFTIVGSREFSRRSKSTFQADGGIHQSYGMTEMASLITLDGYPLPGTEVKLVDGEIWVRGKTLFQGYFSKDTGLCLPVDEQGWFATKDLGAFDSQGRLQIIGRKDNLFISGGENIQPEEIEQQMKKLPGMEEVFVVPMPDPEFGQRPVAFIEPASFTLEQIQSHLKPLLPKFKIPIKLYPLPPKTGLKQSRQELTKLVLCS